MKKFNELQVGDTIYTAYCSDGKLSFEKHSITDIKYDKRGGGDIVCFQSNHKYTEGSMHGCTYFDADVRISDVNKSLAYHADYWKDRMHYTDLSQKDKASELLLKEAIKFETKQIKEIEKELKTTEKILENYNKQLEKLSK